MTSSTPGDDDDDVGAVGEGFVCVAEWPFCCGVRKSFRGDDNDSEAVEEAEEGEWEERGGGKKVSGRRGGGGGGGRESVGLVGGGVWKIGEGRKRGLGKKVDGRRGGGE